ncbi:fibronectin type III domain-containing protein [Anaerobacillus sp. MEB173]|uniref:fibronectin type III domain-containing protein n=1 Tax=Anaerobacillus sp. MEB173 TaxID=3383345 RepID=UPI003F8E58C2
MGRNKMLKQFLAVSIAFLLVFTSFADVLLLSGSQSASAASKSNMNVFVDPAGGYVNWGNEVFYYEMNGKPTNEQIAQFLSRSTNYYLVLYRAPDNQRYMNLFKSNKPMTFNERSGNLHFAIESNSTSSRLNSAGNTYTVTSNGSIRGSDFVIYDLKLQTGSANSFDFVSATDTSVTLDWNNLGVNHRLKRNGQNLGNTKVDTGLTANKTYQYILEVDRAGQTYYTYLDHSVQTKLAATTGFETISIGMSNHSQGVNLEWSKDLGIEAAAGKPSYDQIAQFLATGNEHYLLKYKVNGKEYINLFRGDISFRKDTNRVYFEVRNGVGAQLNTNGSSLQITGSSSIQTNEYKLYQLVKTSNPDHANLRTEERTQNKITVAWNSKTGVKEYVLKRGNQAVSVTRSGATRYADIGLNAGTSYDYTLVTYLNNNRVLVSTLHERTSVSTIIADKVKSADFTLRWLPVSKAIGYIIKRNDVEIHRITGLTNGGTTTQTVYHDKGLKIGETYVYDVIPFFVDDFPADVTNLYVSNVTSTTVELNWITAERATEYLVKRLRCDNDCGPSDKKVQQGNSFTVSELTFTDEKLQPNTSYEYRVLGKNDYATSKNAAIVSTKTAPPTPNSFTADNISSSGYILSWNRPAGTTGFQLVTSCDGQTPIERTLASSVLSFNQTGLNPNTICDVQLFAINSNGDKSDPAQLQVTTLGNEYTAAPATPTSFRVITASTTDTSLELAWDGVELAKTYLVQRYKGSSLERQWEVDGTSMVDDGLEPNTEYNYRLRAVNPVGQSAAATLQHDKVKTLPAMPTNFRIETVSTTSITLNWDHISGTTYKLIRKGEGELDKGPNPVTPAYTDNTLTPNKLYEFILVASNNVGDSEAATVSIRTKPKTLTIPTTNHLQVTGVTSESITLDWDEVTAVGEDVTYDLIRVLVNDNLMEIEQERIPDIVDTNYRDTNVLPGTTYTYYLVAQTATSQSNKRKLSRVKTESKSKVKTPPAKPSLQIDDPLLSNFVRLTWNDVQGAGDYVLRKYEVNTTGNATHVDTITRDRESLYFNDFNVSPGKNYRYDLTARNSSNDATNREGDKASLTVKVPAISANNPAFFAEQVHYTNVHLRWETIQGATRYIVKRNGIAIHESASGTSFIDRNLQPGQSYTYQLEVRKGTAAIPVVTIDVKTNNFYVPLSNGNSTGNRTYALNTANVAELRWDHVEDAAYVLKRGSDVIQDYVNPRTMFTDYGFGKKGLEPNKQYSYTLVVNVAGKQVDTVPLQVQTARTAYSTGNLTFFEDIESLLETKKVVLTWNHVTDAKEYILKRREKADGTPFDSIPGTTISSGNVYSDTNSVEPNTEYEYRFEARRSDNSLINTTQFLAGDRAITTKSLPVANVQVANKGANFVQLSWDAPSGQGNAPYEYVILRNGQEIEQSPLPGHVTSAVDEGLNASSKYTYTIIVRNKGGDSAPVKLDAYTNDAARDFTFKNVSNTTVTLEWDKVNGADKYIVHREPGNVTYNFTANPRDAKLTEANNRLSFTDEGLTAGTEYTYTFTVDRVANGITYSSDPTEKSIVMLNASLGALQGVGISPNSIELTWNAVDGAKEYVLEHRKKGDSSYTSVTLPSDAVTYERKGLESNTEYEFVLTPKDQRGNTIGTPVRLDGENAVATLSNKVGQFKQIDVGYDFAELEWEAPTNDGNVSYEYVIFRDGVEIDNSPVTTLKVRDEGLEAYQQYKYSIVVRNKSGDSEKVLLTVKADVDTPKNFSYEDARPTSVKLTWDPVGDATYVLKRYLPGTSNQKRWEVKGTSYTDSEDLMANTIYEYELIVVPKDGVERIDTSVRLEVALPPQPPMNFHVVEKTRTSAIVEWDAVHGENIEYVLYRDNRIVYTGTNVRVSNDDLEPNTTYTYRVIAKNRVTGAESEPNELQVVTGMAAEPTPTAITITWPKSVGAVSYILTRNNEKIYEGPETTYIDYNITAGVHYVYEVVPVGFAGEIDDKNRIVIESTASPFETWLKAYYDVSAFKEWNVKFNITLNAATITNQNIYVTKKGGDGTPIPGTSVLLNEPDRNSITVKPPKDGYDIGTYYLWVTDNVMSAGASGTKLQSAIRLEFTVGASAEIEDPTKIEFDERVWFSNVHKHKDFTIYLTNELNSKMYNSLTNVVDSKYVYVTAVPFYDAGSINAKAIYNAEKKTITVQPPTGGYVPGQDYYLWAYGLEDKAGDLIRFREEESDILIDKGLQLKFTVGLLDLTINKVSGSNKTLVSPNSTVTLKTTDKWEISLNPKAGQEIITTREFDEMMMNIREHVKVTNASGNDVSHDFKIEKIVVATPHYVTVEMVPAAGTYPVGTYTLTIPDQQYSGYSSIAKEAKVTFTVEN